ncbi:SGNH/GDSL hydrolase family protein [Dyadobacter aurulentus]|uniref:SGNH/GDSL hydrolase family protein n=1 Tax=Dyadobacter sp. UC 10 TaxID=2605428 RepID=UPI0011F22839|nr:SGNH/GDSL hydrolase family protein [Dyadobacter sp. UC 10]KAA0991566.1 SGNH/GDSL hydrolase family protein [Dyadobacter sp. UC 10]
MLSKTTSSIIRLAFLSILFVFLFYPDKWQIKFDYPGFPHADSPKIRLAKTAFWLLLTIEMIRIFYYAIVKSSRKGIAANILTIVSTLGIVLILLEILFMYIPQSHEGVLSKASQIWWQKYWGPINSLGFRDKPILDDKGKKIILVIGDSFAAGHGLKSVDERFSNILERRLGADRYSIYNLGVSGADTRDEVKRLNEFPLKPDIVILQYFPNDIEKAAKEKGLSLSGTEPYADVRGMLSGIIGRFYLPNFIYWQLPHASFSTFEQFVQKAYTDTTILNAHLQDLSGLIAYQDSTKTKMYAVFIPFLFQIDKSNGYTKPVENYLAVNGVELVSISGGIAQIPANQRSVGKNDGHASAAVNVLIAERLYKSMQSGK